MSGVGGGTAPRLNEPEPTAPLRESDPARPARPSAHPVENRRIPGSLWTGRLAARTAPRGTRTIVDAPRTGTVAELAAHKRTLVVTYRRSGVAVPTPVWAAESDGVFYVRSERACGKAKRLRRDTRVLLAPCTKSGRPLGAPLEARGRMLPAEEEPRAERVLAARYGFGRWLFERVMDLMRVDMGYLELTPQSWDQQA
jgi:uncharacterized protein